MDRLETVCYISPVETRQIAVSFIAKHEESDLSLLIYADKTIYSVAVLNISLEGNHNKTVRKSVFVPLSSPFLSFPVHPTPFSSPNSFFRICIIVLRCICIFHFELYMYIDCMLTMLMPYVIRLLQPPVCCNKLRYYILTSISYICLSPVLFPYPHIAEEFGENLSNVLGV